MDIGMKKLFYYSRAASFVVLLTAILLIVNYFTGYMSWFWCPEDMRSNFFFSFRNILTAISYITVLCFFILIYTGSVKGSSLRIPTLIGIISVLFTIYYTIILSHWGIMLVLGIIAAIGLFWTFYRLSKYMKTIPVKALSIAYPCINLISLVNIIYVYFGGKIQFVITILLLLTLSAFYYFFSNIIKNS